MSKYSPGDFLLVQPNTSYMFAAIVTGREKDGRLIVRCVDTAARGSSLTVRSGWRITQLTAAEIETAATRSHP